MFFGREDDFQYVAKKIGEGRSNQIVVLCGGELRGERDAARRAGVVLGGGPAPFRVRGPMVHPVVPAAKGEITGLSGGPQPPFDGTWMMSLGLLPWAGPTMPRISISSTRRAARL